MGLFGNKKKDDMADLPPLQFPELPKSVPAFEPQGFSSGGLEQIKNSISVQSRQSLPENFGSDEKPLFVKIEKYRDVVENLKKLKVKLNEADTILLKLQNLRAEEDRELSMWQSDLERVRNQLMDIDKSLFE